MTLISLNPFTEEVNGEFQAMDYAQCEKAAEAARGCLWTVGERLRWPKGPNGSGRPVKC